MNAIALVIIDAQKEYESDGALPVAGLEAARGNIGQLLSAARQKNLPVVHVRHISPVPGDEDFDAGSKGIEFMDGLEPLENEMVITKNYPSAFSAPAFERFLQREGITGIVITGFSSFLCCDSTARDAFHRDYKVLFVKDAISCFPLDGFAARDLHEYACAVQSVMFSEVVETEEVISDCMA